MSIRSRRAAPADSLSEEALSHLKTYKYSSVDLSPVSHYVLRHYWNWVVEFLPRWLAPNMVTLIGFIFVLLNLAVMEIMVPDLIGPAPGWVYVSFAIGVWMYSTMDNIDGKQARRTGTSSGLGELFDHGIDSLNCTLASLLQVAAMGLGTSYLGAFTAMIPTLPMFFSTWETYHTHTLYLGYFNGPTEGLLIASLMMLASGLWGPEIWQMPIAIFLPGLTPLIGSASVADIWGPTILIAFGVAHLPACVQNVHNARAEKGLPTLPLLVEWTPIVIFTVCVTAWLGSPNSFILKENHLLLFCLTMSLVFGRMTTKIILAHLTRQPFPLWTIMLAPLIGGAILTNVPAMLGFDPDNVFDADRERLYLRLYFVFAFIVYGRWAYLVINAICRYLDISCLTIPRSKWAASNGPVLGVTNGNIDINSSSDGQPKKD